MATYADNWEILTARPQVLLKALEAIEFLLDSFRLPVAVSKCWTWAVRASGRKTFRSFQLFQQPLPVKLSARELGADLSYCYKRAAKVQNSRVKSGHRRFLKLAGLPVPIWRKTRLLLSGVFPHTLHAAETTWVPKTTLQRLRTKVSKGLGLALKGSSPFLACLLGTDQCVDPEFVIVLNRVRTFRQVVRELPELHSFFMAQLCTKVQRPCLLNPWRIWVGLQRAQAFFRTTTVGCFIFTCRLLPTLRSLFSPHGVILLPVGLTTGYIWVT